ncbi:MAG: hypothetical protein HC906_16370 [Bacteroidales bacterium]|nr:hypothetical protein [Bacteroidales bacterium]
MRNIYPVSKALALGLLLLFFFSISIHAQEFLLIDKTFTWTETTGGDGCSGFHFWTDKGDAPVSNNWKIPYDYENGLFYFRYEIISQPQVSPGVYEPLL